MRTRTSAHLPGFGGVGVRGPPGPQWASSRAGVRTWTSPYRQGRCLGASRDGLAVVRGLCVAVDVVAGEDADDLDVGLAAHHAQCLDAGEAEFGERLQ